MTITFRPNPPHRGPGHRANDVLTVSTAKHTEALEAAQLLASQALNDWSEGQPRSKVPPANPLKVAATGDVHIYQPFPDDRPGWAARAKTYDTKALTMSGRSVF